jgi:hypothetical protein
MKYFVLKRKAERFCGISLAALMLVTSCASTKLYRVWKDDTYLKSLNNVLIIGAAPDPVRRRMFEREFAVTLNNTGIHAVPGYIILPTEDMLVRETVESKIQDRKIGAVLITRLVAKKTVLSRVDDWHSYYIKNTQRVYEDEIIHLETTIYDVGTGKLVWTASSETFHMEDTDITKEMRNFIKVVMKQLSEDNLL